jgi:imidazolonepropionase
MKADLIIYNANQLVTCASGGKAKKGAQMRDAGIIENGAVAVKDGSIAGCGESEKIIEKFSAEKMIDAGQHTVCPAFVDCHTHIVYAGDRLDEFELKIKGADYLEILASGGGILSTVEKTRAADLRELIEQGKKRLDKMLENGTCAAEIKTGYGLDTETELKMLWAIEELDKIHAIDLIPTFLPAHAFPPEYKENPNKYVDLICEEMIPKAADWYKNSHFFEKQTLHSPLSTLHFFIDVFCEKNAFDLEQSRRVLETGKKFSLGIKAHVDEFTNLGAARMAIELGGTSIDHLDATGDEEIALLAKSDTIGIVTPTVNFNFGAAEFADARKMIDAGCAIAVSTDFNPGSAPCSSLPMAMAIACRYQKLLPSEAFNAATINAAHALGLGEKTGSIETGKQADILILETEDYRQLTYEFGTNFVKTVIKKGEIVLGKN